MTKIEWTKIQKADGTFSPGKTWNPTTGCNKISQGCKFCYAEVMHKRLQGMGQKKYQKDFDDGVVTHEEDLYYPLSFKKPTTIFVNSMSDLFHADVPFEFIDKVFAVMVCAHRHTFQVLTKRANRMEEYFSVGKEKLIDRWSEAALDLGLSDNNDDDAAGSVFVNNSLYMVWPAKNIWLGVSCEDQANADLRIPFLLKAPAAVRFLSCEPLIGPIDFSKSHKDALVAKWLDESKIHWVIAGGESGNKKGVRPMHPEWVRDIRNQCEHAGVPFFFKQFGNYSYIEKFPYPLEQLAKIKYYWEDDAFVRVAKGTPATKLNNWPLACRAGKSKSGNLLDGVQHLAFPKSSSH